MKDSKRIDNKAKSRRIAAYALAGCMAVTAAPMTMPGMGHEVVEAATITLPEMEDGTYTLAIDKSRIKNTTTFAEVAGKLNAIATDNITASPDVREAVWAKGAKKVEILQNGVLVWDSEGNTSTSGTKSFEYGKTYTINAYFEKTIKDKTGENLITVTNADGTSFDTTTTVVFYPPEGMLTNEDVAGEYTLVDKNGNARTGKAGVYKNAFGWFLVNASGKTVVGSHGYESIEKNANGSWVIGTDGKVDFSRNGIVSISSGGGNASITGVADGSYYVENGKVVESKTGVVKDGTTWYSVIKGKVAAPDGKATVMKASNGKWVYINTSGVSAAFDGLAENANGTWYVKDGVVDFTKDGLVKVNDTTKVEDNLSGNAEYFVLGGKVQSNTSGVVFFEDTAISLEKGKLVTSTIDEDTLAKDSATGRWYLIDYTNGRIKTGFTGLATNSKGTWYVKAGEVDFEKKGIVPINSSDNTQNVAGDESYYVEGGKVQTTKNGVVIARDVISNAEGVYNLKAGKVSGTDADKSAVKAPNGKWYVIGSDGKPEAYSLGANSNGVWFSNASGIIDFKAQGLRTVNADEAAISGLYEDDVVYIKDGKMQKSLTGLTVIKKATANLTTGSGVIYIEKGIVADGMKVTKPTVVKGIDGIWYYVNEDGQTQTGQRVASNTNGTWFVNANGIVDFEMNGFYKDTDEDKTFYFENSKLVKDKTGLVKAYNISTSSVQLLNVEKGVVTGRETKDNVVKGSDGIWYYVDEDGKTSTTFNGVAQNKNGVWIIKNGRVDFTRNGIIDLSDASLTSKSDKIDALEDDTVYVVNGKVQLDYSGFVVDGTNKALFEKGQVVMNDDPVLEKGTDGKWYYLERGEVADYTGLAKNDNGIWYVYKGTVSFGKTGVINQEGDVAGTKLEAGKYYVVNGKMTGDKNGIVKSNNKQYYVKKSAVVSGISGDESVIKIDGTWYYINPAGEVDTPANHIAENKNGVWYIEDGKVNFKKQCTVAVGAGDTVVPSLSSKTIYISGGKFQDEAECVVIETAGGSTTRTYVKNGVKPQAGENKLGGKNTAVIGTDGKWYGVSGLDGNAVMTTEGLAKTDDSVVYVSATTGLVNLKKTGKVVIPNTDLKSLALVGIDSAPAGNTDVAVIDGKVPTTSTGVIKVGADRFNVVKGVCTATSGTAVIVSDANDKQIRYYVPAGTYTVATNSGKLIADDTAGTSWYVEAGKVKYTNINNFFYNDKVYNIKEGKAYVSEGDNYRVVTCSNTKQYLLKADGSVYTSDQSDVNGKDYTIHPTTHEITAVDNHE